MTTESQATPNVILFKNGNGIDVLALLLECDGEYIKVQHPLCLMQFTAQNRITGQPEVGVQFVPFTICIPPTAPDDYIIPMSGLQMLPVRLPADNQFYAEYIKTVLGAQEQSPQILVG